MGSKRRDKAGGLSKTEERNKQAEGEIKGSKGKRSWVVLLRDGDKPVQDDGRDDERGVVELPRGMIAGLPAARCLARAQVGVLPD